MGLCCKRCGRAEHLKNGLIRGKQRYLCKACSLTLTDTPARGKPLAMKVVAVLLYVSGHFLLGCMTWLGSAYERRGSLGWRKQLRWSPWNSVGTGQPPRAE